jgi:hypothetical protein
MDRRSYLIVCDNIYYKKTKEELLLNKIRLIGLTILLFFYIFSISVPHLPEAFSTRRMAALALVVICVVKNRGCIYIENNIHEKHYYTFILFNFICLAIGIITLAFIGTGTGRSIISNYLEYIIFGSFAFYGIKNSLNNLDEFMYALLITSVLQCFIVLCGLLSNEFRSVLVQINDSSIWDLNHMADYGYALGLGCVTSTGAMKLSLGTLASVYFLTKEKSGRIKFFLLYVFISFISIAVARTGFFIALISAIGMILFYFGKGIEQLIKVIIFLVCIGGIIYLILRYTNVADYLQIYLKRLLNTIGNDSWGTFFERYMHSDTTVMPQIGIFGELTTSGVSGLGNRINVDGGFRKVFFAMGIPLACIYYSMVTFFSLYLKTTRINRSNSLLNVLFFTFLVIGEFKEYFIADVYYFTLLMIYKYFSSISNMCTIQEENRGD